MPEADGDGMVRMLRNAAVAVVLAASVAPCGAADPARPRAGGFVPAPMKTREELVREWDLNSDGKIDQGEAEVASSRMRRERAELRLNSGIDPITGLPRGEPLPAPEPAAKEKDEDEPAEDSAVESDVDESPPLPGTRVPRKPPPGPVRRQAEPQPAPGPAPGSRAAADASRRPVTGGVRAGGLPARAGHGSAVPDPALNAGLPIVPKTRPPLTTAAQPRGGLVPAPRQPPTPPRPAPAASRSAGSRDMYDPY